MTRRGMAVVNLPALTPEIDPGAGLYASAVQNIGGPSTIRAQRIGGARA
jgi:hypothetical protein